MLRGISYQYNLHTIGNRSFISEIGIRIGIIDVKMMNLLQLRMSDFSLHRNSHKNKSTVPYLCFIKTRRQIHPVII